LLVRINLIITFPLIMMYFGYITFFKKPSLVTKSRFSERRQTTTKKLDNLGAAFAMSDNIHSHILLYIWRDACQPLPTDEPKIKTPSIYRRGFVVF